MNATKPEEPTGQANQPAGEVDRLRSLTRLVIGGVEIGADELLRRLHIWEHETAAFLEEANASNSQTSQSNAGDLSPAQSPTQQARFALIGFIFDLQDQLRAGVTTFGRLQQWTARLVQPFLWPLRASGLFAPARRRYERLIQRGEEELARWISTGAQEEAHSRVLAEKAFDDIVDTYIEYLASNPEVQELVQAQSTGLANEVVEEVRERTVSADTFLEGVARSLLRRVPRAALPAPPPDVRAHAASLRPEKKTKRPTQ